MLEKNYDDLHYLFRLSTTFNVKASKQNINQLTLPVIFFIEPTPRALKW